MSDEAVKAAAEAVRDLLWSDHTDEQRYTIARVAVEAARERIFREVGVAMLQLEDIQADRDAGRAEAARYRAALEEIADLPLAHGKNAERTADRAVGIARAALDGERVTVAEMGGAFEGGPDSVEWLREQRGSRDEGEETT